MKTKPRVPARRKAATLSAGIAEGPTETISASVPSSLVRLVRQRVGAREFSQFVTRSMERELTRLNRAQFVADVEQETGPLDPAEVEAARRLIRA
jgi:hypothetical protein